MASSYAARPALHRPVAVAERSDRRSSAAGPRAHADRRALTLVLVAALLATAVAGSVAGGRFGAVLACAGYLAAAATYLSYLAAAPAGTGRGSAH